MNNEDIREWPVFLHKLHSELQLRSTKLFVCGRRGIYSRRNQCSRRPTFCSLQSIGCWIAKPKCKQVTHTSAQGWMWLLGTTYNFSASVEIRIALKLENVTPILRIGDVEPGWFVWSLLGVLLTWKTRVKKDIVVEAIVYVVLGYRSTFD